MTEQEDKKIFIDALDAQQKEIESDLSKFLLKVYGEDISEHTFLTSNNVKGLMGLYTVGVETGDKFFETFADRLMKLKLSEEGKNRRGIERVFTGGYSPSVIYRQQELERGENGEEERGKRKTKRGLLRRFL